MRWHIDHLTGLHNREAFARRLRHARSLAVRGSVVLLDIDHFKVVNDRHGLQMGDEALRGVARRLSESLPHDTVLSRIGGDEFMVFLPDVETHAAEGVMRRCLDRVKEPLERLDGMAPLTMSGGLAAFDGHGIDDVFKACDIAMDAAKQQGCDRILMIPLYPQYAASTTATALDAVASAFARMRNQPALRTVRHFHDHPGYISALVNNISSYWMKHGRPDRLVMSFHGVPRYTLEKGDPYHCECQKTARLVAEALKLRPDQYLVAFQSRFGRAEWLTPYTAEVLNSLGAQHIGRVDVTCPGFVSDCLETLEEIAIEGKAIFSMAGGRDYHYIDCLNERDDWIHALADIAAANLLGWVAHEPSTEQLVRSRERALALGARA